MPPVNVEFAFGNFIRSFGGEVLEDSIGNAANFANADYLFRDQNIVAELKRLVDDKLEDNNIQTKIQEMFDRWIGNGTIGPIFGTTRVQSNTLPIQCQRELIDVYKPPIQKRLLKANKQIKQTKVQVGMPSAKGLIFVVNDGNYALEANSALYLINRILGSSFAEINSIVYFTVNMFANTPLTSKPSLIWVHATRQSIAVPVDSSFLMQMFYAWRNYLQVLTGEPIQAFELNDPNQVEHMHYKRGA